MKPIFFHALTLRSSDTTAATLTHIFYYLAKDPDQVRKLRAEEEQLQYIKKGFLSDEALRAHHLNGVINEALRLHHPVSSGVQRLTPPEGLTIDGTFIPGDTTVICPFFSLGRCGFHVPILPALKHADLK